MPARIGMERLLAFVERASVQKATLVETLPPDPKRWCFELKWDGYRMLAVKSGAQARLISRNHQDWTESFAPVAAAMGELEADECVIDGEVCALDERGLPSFQNLQARQRAPRRLIYVLFDLLWLEGEDLRSQPLEQRRARLEHLLAETGQGTLIVSRQFEGDPAQILKLACERGLEGIIAKQKGSKYLGARATSWLKIKCSRRQEFVIAGYVPLAGTKNAVGGLLLALHDDQGFYFAGKVGTGLSDETRYELARLLEPERMPRVAVRGVPRLAGQVRYCKPKYVCEVEFTEWTAGGHVRHPSYRGLRADKKPEECAREQPSPVAR